MSRVFLNKNDQSRDKQKNNKKLIKPGGGLDEGLRQTFLGHGMQVTDTATIAHIFIFVVNHPQTRKDKRA